MTKYQRQVFVKAASTALSMILREGKDEDVLAVMYSLIRRVHSMEERTSLHLRVRAVAPLVPGASDDSDSFEEEEEENVKSGESD